MTAAVRRSYFLSATDMGRTVGMESTEGDVTSEVPEVELRERGDATEERNGIGSE